MSHAINIAESIRDMGYLLAKPISTPVPSYYKLGDGTILSVLVRINHILTDTSESGTGALNHSIDIRAFVPHRHKEYGHNSYKSMQLDRPPTIVEQDVKCTPLREEFNDYTVGNYIKVSAKAVVAQVARTDSYSNEGEPIYSINAQPVIKVVDKRRQSFTPDMR